ncbi:MAG: transferase [Negativicutes bacterium]|nr:transferase [Negativicutes bacterium]
MQLSLPYTEFIDYTAKQLNHFFPDNKLVKPSQYSNVFDIAIERTHYCFKHVTISSYYNNGETYLNHLHANQYAVYLWFLSNTVWLETQNDNLANKIYYLNRTLHSLSCMYDAKMPRIFLLLHIVGTVLGKAEYSDFFVAIHGCTVGAQDGSYPKIGKGVALLPHSSIIGNCCIGDRVSVGINANVYKRDISSDTAVFVDRSTGILSTKPSKEPWVQHLFNVKI